MSKMVEVPLTKGFVALVDASDFDRVSQYSWHACVRRTVVYSARSFRVNGKRANQYLHRFLLDDPAGMEVDHKDGDGLNCTRGNLRVVSHQDNARNRGRFARGVSWHKAKDRWRAYIKINGRHKDLGYFHSQSDAIAARENAVIEHFGALDARKEERRAAV